jgi:hypothetical protein
MKYQKCFFRSHADTQLTDVKNISPALILMNIKQILSLKISIHSC